MRKYYNIKIEEVVEKINIKKGSGDIERVNVFKNGRKIEGELVKCRLVYIRGKKRIMLDIDDNEIENMVSKNKNK